MISLHFGPPCRHECFLLLVTQPGAWTTGVTYIRGWYKPHDELCIRWHSTADRYYQTVFFARILSASRASLHAPADEFIFSQLYASVRFRLCSIPIGRDVIVVLENDARYS